MNPQTQDIATNPANAFRLVKEAQVKCHQCPARVHSRRHPVDDATWGEVAYALQGTMAGGHSLNHYESVVQSALAGGPKMTEMTSANPFPAGRVTAPPQPQSTFKSSDFYDVLEEVSNTPIQDRIKPPAHARIKPAPTSRTKDTATSRGGRAEVAKSAPNVLNPGPKSKVVRRRRARRNAQQRPAPRQKQAQVPRTVLAPVAIGVRSRQKNPRLNTSGRMCRITHSELITGSIQGQTTFTLDSYNLGKGIPVNPGCSVTFPWLSTQAVNWEQYRIVDMRFRYVPVAPTNTAGEVFLIPDYNSSDRAPTSEQNAMSYHGAVCDSCWKPITLRLDRGAMFALSPTKFIRQNQKPINVDIKTYDCARVYVFTNNATATTPFGKLFVDYTIDLLVPQVNPLTSGLAPLPDHIVRIYSSSGTYVIPRGQNEPVFNNSNFTTTDTITDPDGVLTVNSPGNGVNVAPGSYQVSMTLQYIDPVVEGFNTTFTLSNPLDSRSYTCGNPSMTIGTSGERIVTLTHQMTFGGGDFFNAFLFPTTGTGGVSVTRCEIAFVPLA